MNQSIEKNEKNFNSSSRAQDAEDSTEGAESCPNAQSKVLSNPRAQALHEYIQQRVSNSSSQKSDLGQLQTQEAELKQPAEADALPRDTHLPAGQHTDKIDAQKLQAYQQLIDSYQLSDDDIFKNLLQSSSQRAQAEEQTRAQAEEHAHQPPALFGSGGGRASADKDAVKEFQPSLQKSSSPGKDDPP